DIAGYLDPRRDPIAELQRLAKQDVRAKAFPVGFGADDFAVVDGTAEKDASSEAVAKLKDVVRQHPGPGRPKIELVRVMATVDLAAEGWARLHHPAQIGRQAGGPGIGHRRWHDDLAIEIDAVLLATQ